MKRIFSDYAYGAGPRLGCYWDETADIAPNPVLQGEITCDVVVVGAGFTGLSAAYHLAKAGASVVVVDAQAVGWGASGRNGGFCCLGGAMASDAMLDRNHGAAARVEWRRTERAAVEFTESLTRDLDLDVDRHSVGETQLAHRARDAAGFQAQAKRSIENYGVTADILTKEGLSAAGMAGPFFGAITTPLGFALNPRKYIAGLADAAANAGAHVFDQSAVTHIDAHGVRTTDGRVKADRVILATNGYSSDDVPDWLAGRYMPAQSTIIVTRRLNDAEIQAQGWSTAQMAYDSRHLLHYFRLMPDRRFLFGMRGGVFSTPAAEKNARIKVAQHFRRMFPSWAKVDITHAWSGMVCLSRGRVPFAGPVPGLSNVLAGFAYHGNGVAMGTLTGRILADLALGHTPEQYPVIMKTPVHRFPLGPMRRAIMPPLYTAFRLDDARP